MMPYITEELWQRLPTPADGVKAQSISISKFPEPLCFDLEKSKAMAAEYDLVL